MPRTHIPGASTLRNRNRITNKTRLKIVRGHVEGDDLLLPDEDDEKHRLTNLVAGVDAEDANEHHLQEVLSAAHRATKKAEEKAAAFIPIPDSTGVAENWEELYPANVWKDPATFVCTSTTVEESVRDGLANGFSYFMDERDKEWLDKNNEEARGEGTSAQGAISAASSSGIRTSARSAKAKGKEPDLHQPVVISEDEFELVMGLFEKVTHEKTEFLHHSLETGMPFPAFSEYQDVFSSPLAPAVFATFVVPTWIPQPQHLLRTARTVYPYWKERRIERAGHRIIPILNFDESDTLNESYICFRRREIKAVRKTRQAQVTSSDKLARLQAEFAYPLELARHVLQRETVKREQAQQAQQVWERRMALADLKRKFPAFADKVDEELLVDKERVVKRPDPPRPPGVRIPPNNSMLQPLRPEPVIKPRERIAQVKDKTDAYLARRKEEDKIWEDVVDNPYQTPYTSHASRLFKFIPPPSAPSWPSDASDKTAESDGERPSSTRALRMRYGRGGRVFIDRRDFGRPLPIRKLPRSSLFGSGGDEDDKMDVDEEDPEEVERTKRQEERWRFDQDDAPPSPTADESLRTLVDEFDPKYLRHSMMSLTEMDHQSLTTDPTLYLPTPEGRQLTVVPYRIGYNQPPTRPFRQPAPGGLATPVSAATVNGVSGQTVPVGTPVAVQLKKMPPPASIPQMRISSNGGMRPPGVPASALPNGATPQQSPPQPLSLPAAQHAPINGVNGTGRAAIAMPHVEMKSVVEASAINGVTPATPAEAPTAAANQEAAATVTSAVPNGVPARPKSQNQVPLAAIANGLHIAPVNPATAAAAAFVAGGYQQLQNGQHMSPQKMQELKSIITSMTGSQQLAAYQAQAQTNRAFAQNYIHANGNAQSLQIPGGVNMKLPRQLQWAGMQRPPSAMNVVDGVGVNGAVVNGVASPSPQHMIPVRSPSTNGIRPGMRVGSAGHQMSPHLQHSPLPNTGQSQSPPRHMLTPSGAMASPPIQHQPPVGSTQNGY